MRLCTLTFRVHLWLTDVISRALISSAHVRYKIRIWKDKPFRPPSRVQYTLSLTPWVKINAWHRFFEMWTCPPKLLSEPIIIFRMLNNELQYLWAFNDCLVVLTVTEILLQLLFKLTLVVFSNSLLTNVKMCNLQFYWTAPGDGWSGCWLFLWHNWILSVILSGAGGKSKLGGYA